MKAVVIMPVYNEAEALPFVLPKLANFLDADPLVERFEIVLVNDCSTDASVEIAKQQWVALGLDEFTAKLHIVSLPHNQGHQGALATGFIYSAKLDCDAFLVMDADGQDDCSALPQMFAELQSAQIVFARRSARAESRTWTLGYLLYQYANRLVLGHALQIGNFSAFTPAVLHYLIDLRDLKHMGAQLFFSPFKKAFVEVPRVKRVRGDSKMSFFDLIDFAVSAMTSSMDAWVRFFTRLAACTMVLAATSLVIILSIKLFTPLAIPGWASTTCLLLALAVFQSIGFLVTLTFLDKIVRYHLPSRSRLLAGLSATHVIANRKAGTFTNYKITPNETVTEYV